MICAEHSEGRADNLTGGVLRKGGREEREAPVCVIDGARPPDELPKRNSTEEEEEDEEQDDENRYEEAAGHS